MRELPPLREADYRWRFGMPEYLEACHRAFRMCGEGAVASPPRQETVATGPGPTRFHLEMHCEWPDRYRACKVIEEVSDVGAGRLGGRQARLTLEDLVRGQRVTLEADLITDMRTGAASALGVGYLAGPGVRRVALVGAGRIGRAAGLALDSLFELEEIRLVTRSRQSALACAVQIGPRLRTRLHLADGLADGVHGVDAVVTAVPAASPILSLESVGQARLSVVAGDPRTRQLEPEVLERLGVVVDHLEQAWGSGDFRWAREEGRGDRINLCRGSDGKALDIGDAACGRLPGGAHAPRLVYLTGLAAQDLMTAVMVYEALCL